MESVSNQPHPFSNGKPLQGQILRNLEGEISKIKDRSQPNPWELDTDPKLRTRRNQLYL